MAISDNTTQIGRTYTGPNPILAGLDTERSRAAFRQRVKARESKAVQLKEYCWRYCSRWTLEEKLSLISSYGEISLVKNRNDSNEVTERLVETLLINLTDKELNQIVADVNKSTVELQQTMKTYAKNADSRGKIPRGQSAVNIYRRAAQSNPRQTERVGGTYAGASGAGEDIGAEMQRKDITFTPSKFSGKIAQILDRELTDVLSGMSVKELLILCSKLEIKTKNAKPGDLRKEIITLAKIYVTAITGEGAKDEVTVPVNSQDALDTLDNLIGQTSYAWVVGKPMLSQSALAELRKKAKMKQEEFKSRQKMIENEIKKSSYSSKQFSELTGGLKGTSKSVADQLENKENDKGFLREFTFEQLCQKAAELGIDVDPRKITVGKLKAQIYAKFAEEQKRQEDLAKKLMKAKQADEKTTRKKHYNEGYVSESTKQIQQELDSAKETFKKIQSTAGELPGASQPTSGKGGIPLVEFTDGKITTRELKNAVPVFIVGNTSAEELYKQGQKEKEAANQAKKADKGITLAALFDEAINEMGKSKDKKKLSHKDKKQAKAFTKNSEKLNEYKEKVKDKLYKDSTKFVSNIKKEAKKRKEDTYFLATATNTLTNAGQSYAYYLGQINKTMNVSDVKASKASIDNNYNLYKDILNNGALTINPETYDASTGKEKTAIESTETETKPEATIVLGANNEKQDVKKYISKEKMINSSPDAVFGAKDLYRFNMNEKAKKGKKWSLFSSANSNVKDNGSISGDNGWGDLDLSSSDWGQGKYVKDKDGNLRELGDSIFYNTAAKKLLSKQPIRREPVTPVFITNGYTEYINNVLEQGLNKVVASTGAIYQYLSSQIPVLFAGLQSAGTAYNIASPSAAAATVLDLIEQAADSAMIAIDAGSTSNVYKYATGGTGTATTGTSAGYSQFIAGDSNTSKANPEMITVDWNNKRFAVKPANENGNTVSNKTTMTKEELGTAFSVKLSEGTIKYKSDKEAGSSDNVAIKVYPITPGLTDKIDVGGSSVSVVELIANMYVSLSSIESLMGTSVELSKIIAAGQSSGKSTTSASNIDISDNTFTTGLDSILRGE